MSLFETKSRYQARTLTKAQYIDPMHAAHGRSFEYADFLGSTDIDRIEIAANQVVMVSRTSGIKIICDRLNKRIAPLEILNFGAYEKMDAHMIFRLIGPGFTVLDIGANIGWYALNIARLSGAGQFAGSVCAFDRKSEGGT